MMTLARWLRAAAQWLYPLPDEHGPRVAAEAALAALRAQHAYCVPVPHDDVFASATLLTTDWNDRQASGEYKRHQVLASLMKAFPTRSHRDIALAIEAALYGTD